MARVWELGRQQDGVVHVDQLADLDVAARTVRDRVVREGLLRPQHGVVCLPGAEDHHRMHARAALLAGGPRTLLAGRSVLHLAGVLPQAPTTIDVLVPYDRAPVLRPPARVRRSRTLLASDASSLAGLATTTVERALLDIAAWEADPADVVDLVLDAVQQRATTPDRILRRLEQRAPIRGRGRVREAALLARDGIASALERRVLPLLRSVGIDPPVPQCPVRTPVGTLHLDFGWPLHRVGIECLGLRFHNDRVALRRDVGRMNALRHCGWTIVWVEWDAVLHRPEAVVAEVLAAHQS